MSHGTQPFLHLSAFLAAVLSVGCPGTIKYSRLAKERAHIRDARERDGCRQVHRILCGRACLAALPLILAASAGPLDEDNTEPTRKENLKRVPLNPRPTSLAVVEQNGRTVIV
ncbi:hypothetical protein MRX96_021457 [Rhipicephalus microplus]